MQHDSGATADRPAGVEPHAAAHDEEIHLPSPTIWPFVCAAGIGLLGFGILTHLAFSAAGVLLIGWSLAGWIREMLDE